MNEVRTVSDTKRAFYTAHTRPVNSIYRRVVEELMVEMHLLSVNAGFRYDSIYALGVVTIFDRFMQGYRPERDVDSIFQSLCQAIGEDPATYRQHAEQVRSEAAALSPDELVAQVGTASSDGEALVAQLRRVADNPEFKYSRLFAVGLLSLLEAMNLDLANDMKQADPWLTTASEALKLPPGKLQKDLELYRSNLEKFSQAQIAMADILKADRKKKEERAKQKEEEAKAKAAPPTETPSA